MTAMTMMTAMMMKTVSIVVKSAMWFSCLYTLPEALVLVNSCSLTTTTYNAAAATTLSYTATDTAVAAASATGSDSASSDATTSGGDSSSSTGTLSSSTVSTATATGEAAITLAPGILRTAALVGVVALL